MSDEALDSLLSGMEMRIYPKNTYITRSGEIGRHVFFIEGGVTRSIFHYDGTDTTTWFGAEGDITFGMYSLYHNSPSVESVQTLTECKLYVITIEELNRLYDKYIDIANWGRIVHQDNNRMLSHIFVERLQMPPRERYERFMQHFPGVLNRVKLKHVAEFLGISIYTLSRIRSNKAY